MENLGKTLKLLKDNDETNNFSQMAVEGMDTIFLTLKDIANQYDDDDMLILESMTGDENNSLTKIRESYLSHTYNLDSVHKALMLSATSDMDNLKHLFMLLGKNYKVLH